MDLPITFRINPNEPSYEVIKNKLKTEYQFDRIHSLLAGNLMPM